MSQGWHLFCQPDFTHPMQSYLWWAFYRILKQQKVNNFTYHILNRNSDLEVDSYVNLLQMLDRTPNLKLTPDFIRLKGTPSTLNDLGKLSGGISTQQNEMFHLGGNWGLPYY